MATTNCYVDFWKDHNFKGKTRHFNGPDNESDLSDHHWDGESGFFNELDDAIKSLKTGSRAWIKVYSRSDYKGDMRLIGPNSNIGNLGDIGMDHTIASFKLFDYKPLDENQVLSNFLDLYPDATRTSNFGSPALQFYSQDTHYRIYYPTVEQSDQTVSFSMKLDHMIGGGGDDHATVSFSMDLDGNFVDQIEVNYDLSSGAFHVPKWVLKFINKGIDKAAEEAIAYLDGAEIAFTMGLGTELVIPTDILILAGAEALTAGVNHTNDVIDYLFALGDNGGTLYLSSIVTHAISRLIFAYFQQRYEQNSGPLLTFDKEKFANFFNDSWDKDLHNDAFTFHVDGNGFRIYVPDSTPGYSKAGMIVSAKADAINSMSKDDYLSVQCAFDPAGNLLSVQGSIDIWGAPDDSSDKEDYVGPSSGIITRDKDGKMMKITKGNHKTLSGYDNLESAWLGEITASLQGNSYVNQDKFSDALNDLPNAGLKIIQAMVASI